MAQQETVTEYILGHSDREIRRLMLQASILRPITERLLRRAGLKPGMRVLDLGCGAGDVSMLAAEIVGPSGLVVGIDRSPQAIAIARERCRSMRLHHVDFDDVAVESFIDPDPFDLVIGRYVLIHQPDPVAFIRSASGHLRHGGVLALHELCFDGQPITRSRPVVAEWDRVGALIQEAFRSAAPNGDAGGRLLEHFQDAGLPRPSIFCESLVGGGPDSHLYAWVSYTFESVMPRLEHLGSLAPGEIDTRTLEARLRDAAVQAKSQLTSPPQYCAWATV